ncbi:MAG: hypothetical protein B7Y36_06610 [Novosphingobium sp. 28-62-57]|uniref:hypothetical protein n=1 Tax=unclassified Novosphingobium TaxID=2644732 RepID=UPI000BCF73F1|nr:MULTISPECIES: hypothetical protein [unclassified Novosphingobium]OYW51143.1 MAG: hypothetical protein B7Z34_02410 [Novosphingobium sp. 12-62-10]OYZ11036.1 MAG: hypothetical protein B7Y36_06610 [Novosphingobium sp. 28-62-57]OZA30811.1 MAG: hypothetical protein B7X92_15600 [Novosphingobium sp. 17-62-9]HQS68753.1 hypothetical protein [Novosphingobium sp.]
MTNISTFTGFALAAMLTVVSAPAQAESAPASNSNIDKSSRVARAVVVGAWTGAGMVACGRKCAKSGGKIGGAVFDGSKAAARKGSEVLHSARNGSK